MTSSDGLKTHLPPMNVSVQADSVCDATFPDVFASQPMTLEVVAPGYLAGETQRGAHLGYRRNAGR